MMVIRQAQDDALNMITSVKFFSREELHLEEQSQASDQFKAINLRRTICRCIFVVIRSVSGSFSFTVSLLVLVYNFDQLDINAGKRERQSKEIF